MQYNDHQDDIPPNDSADTLTPDAIWRAVPDYINFLKQPMIVPHQKFSILSALQIALLLIITLIMSMIIAILIVEPYSEYLNLPDTEIARIDMPFAQLFFMVAIAAPIIEEILFRSWLRCSRRALLIAGLSFAMGVGYWVVYNHVNSPLIFIILLTLWTNWIMFEAFFGLKKHWHNHAPMPEAVRHYPYIFYATAGAFALIHISNYDHDSIAVLIPLVSTQFLSGLVMGYVRLRYGIVAAIASHSFHNAILISLAELSGGI